LIDELADAMGTTDTEGGTYDWNVDDGILAVCNNAEYNNNYDFDVDGDQRQILIPLNDNYNSRFSCLLKH